MSETKFTPVRTGESKDNGIMKIARGGKLLTFENGQETSKGELPVGLVTEGTYVSASPNKFNPEKNDYLVREADGTLTILASCATLDRQLSAVQPGELIQVLYKGRKNITRKAGGTVAMHDYQVLRAIVEAESAG